VRRLGAPRIPVGYSSVLEAQSRIDAETVVGAVRAFLR
jgi:pyruvate dehydrogenase E1 component beta subunit